MISSRDENKLFGNERVDQKPTVGLRPCSIIDEFATNAQCLLGCSLPPKIGMLSISLVCSLRANWLPKNPLFQPWDDHIRNKAVSS